MIRCIYIPGLDIWENWEKRKSEGGGETEWGSGRERPSLPIKQIWSEEE